ncbi:MAG: hypothetical protein JSR73_11055 [Proteobacteria bacterium]|nr:hypothetical protein [Pseudomonadota bacterium]
MRRTAKPLALMSLAAVVAAGAAARADDAPATTSAAATESAAMPAAERPERGMHMSAVEARYGAPATRYPAVGQPAITRWDYPGFVVYFENDLVLHAVLISASG